MADPGRPGNPDVSELQVSGEAGTVKVNPRAVTMERKDNYPWGCDSRGWLNIDNHGWVSDLEKDEMLLDTEVSSALYLRRSWVMMDGVQIVPTEGVEPMLQYRVVNPKYERAVKAAELCRWMLCNTADSFHTMLMQLQEADWWRNCAADLVWRDQEGGEYAGKLMLDRMPVYGPWDYSIWRKNGHIIGLEPAVQDPGEKRKVYPIDKYALHIFRPNRRRRNGNDLAGVVQLAHYMKREGQPEELRHMALFASPTAVSKAPKSQTGMVPKLDENGEKVLDANGDEILVSPQAAMAAGVKNGVFNGGYVGLPGDDADLYLLQAVNGGQIFSNFTRDRNWEIAVGILGTGTLTQEQNYGSNATAKTGEQTVSRPVFNDKMALADVIKKSICGPAVAYNLPPNYRDVIPTVTCGDTKANIWVELFKVLMNSPQTQLQAPELCRDIAERNGVTGLDFVRIREAAQNGEPLPGTVPGTAAGTSKG